MNFWFTTLREYTNFCLFSLILFVSYLGNLWELELVDKLLEVVGVLRPSGRGEDGCRVPHPPPQRRLIGRCAPPSRVEVTKIMGGSGAPGQRQLPHIFLHSAWNEKIKI
jgi:hypothetical protein